MPGPSERPGSAGLPVDEVSLFTPGSLGAPVPQARQEPPPSRTPPPPTHRRAGGVRWRRRVLPGTATLAAVALVWFALVAPDRSAELSAAALLRIPVEGLVLVGLLLALPARAARMTALVAGLLLGVVADLKLIDAGFYESLDRPAHLVTDWPTVGNAMDYVTDTSGRAMADALAVVAALVVVGLVALFGVCALRVGTLVGRHRTATRRSLAVLAPAWVGCAVLGVQLVPGQPLAARSFVSVAAGQVSLVHTDLRDRALFAGKLGPDRFDSVPDAALLTGLRGKDVVLAFVESYGRTAIEDPVISPGIDAVLDTGTTELAAAGFGARSAFLTSPITGGGSWFAHSTLLSGTWIDNQARYGELLASRRTTLVDDFNRAGWQTVATMPGTGKSWPEGSFYGYTRIDLAQSLGYHGPRFGFSPMPDQFTLSAVQARNLAPAPRRPVMVEVELTSSHTPWAPLPTTVGWDAVGDGSVYDPMPSAGRQPGDVWPDQARVRTEYGRSIRYSLSTLISFLQTYGTDNTVLVLLGDHQPAPIVTGAGASRDVPITIVARDPGVLNRISSWGWQDGLRPRPDAPVATMDSFRDRFLAAFSASTP